MNERGAAGGRDRSGTSKGPLRLIASGIVTGAADDDPSAIGTYASAGARFGFGFLWIAPVLLPMMYVVVYLSAKIGRVYGKGLFGAVRDRYPRWVLAVLVTAAVLGNLIEAAANLGGMGAALNLLVPLPIPLIVVVMAAAVLGLQIFGSYDLIRILFRWLAVALFAYVAAAVLAKPDWSEVLTQTLRPSFQWNVEFLMVVVACLGTSLSAYVYTWQSNQEVEEQILEGKRQWWQRRGATRAEMGRTRREVVAGMLFSNLILYFIILSTAATLHVSGQHNIESAAQAATALEPVAGPWARLLFAAGVVGVGFLAVPVMTTGAAYDLVQGVGGNGSLHHRLGEARLFYGVIMLATMAAIAMNFLGFDPMRALVWSGLVQGLTVPPLLLVMMLMTNDKTMMQGRENGWMTNTLGWATTGVTFAAAACLLGAWLS